MRVAPLERRRIDGLAQLLDLVPTDAGASHPGIDLDMEGALAARGPFEDATGVAERRSQVMAGVLGEQLGTGRHENEDRPGDSGPAQLESFVDCGDAVAPRIELLEGFRY